MKLNILLVLMLLPMTSCMEKASAPQEAKSSPGPNEALAEPIKPEIAPTPTKLEATILLPKDHSFSAGEELDLHGKRVKRAQELIESFLDDSFKAGKNFVLIITGKGIHSKEKKTLSDGTEAGLIKYNFLNWIDSGIFDKFIESLSYAHGVHGGEGAFYIKMRK